MRRLSILFALALLSVAGCKKSGGPVRPSKDNGPAGTITIQGAGSTFAYPIYSKWAAEFGKSHPKVHMNYQAIGSGGGIRQITAKTVDFGGTDVPLTAEEHAKAPGLEHFPMSIGSVVVSYHLDGVKELKLSQAAVAGIFLGKITKWNDPAIAKDNAGVKLPDTAITVAHRSDGSGTTGVFTDYLSAISPEWKSKVGAGKSVKWPVGVGAKGNAGVAGQIKNSPGGIGYIELAYAMQTHQPYAELQNQAGNWAKPTVEGCSAAAAGAAKTMPDTLTESLVNAPGDQTYPICSYTYVVVYQDMSIAPDKAKALAEFLWWGVHDGQKFGAPLYYSKLPPVVVNKLDAKLKALKAGGKVLLADAK